MQTELKHRFQHDFDGMYNGCLQLTDEDVDRLLTPNMAKAAVRDALICHAHGNCVQPLKMYTRPRGRSQEYVGGRFIAMPAYVGPPIDAAGIKWIAGFPRNCEMGLPRASAKLMLNCTLTGRVIADMDCATLSIRRTAAVATISIEQLAVTRRLNIAILGAGPISQGVIESILASDIDVASFRVFDPNAQRVELLQNGFASANPPPIHAAASVRDCVQKSDVVIAATSGKEPCIERAWISRGTLLVMLSLNDPTDELFLSADKIITDDFDQCCREEKLLHRLVIDGRFSRKQMYAELGEIVARKKTGREHRDEVILVNPMGMAIEDVTVGKAVYVAAKQKGLGSFVNCSSRPDLPTGFSFQPQVSQREVAAQSLGLVSKGI